MKPLRLPPVLQLILCGGIAWYLDYHFDQFSLEVPGIKMAGFVIASIGALLIGVSVGAFRQSGTTVNPIHPENTRELITTGLYRVSRNPMYLGMLLLLFGYGLQLKNYTMIIPVALFVVGITRLQILPEEAALREKFGEAYEHYVRRSRRWL